MIEGACRHLIGDRLDISGARWGLDGAEAVLKLRAVRTNGDFDRYWHFGPYRRATPINDGGAQVRAMVASSGGGWEFGRDQRLVAELA